MRQNAIYGIGIYGQAFYKAMLAQNVDVDYFIDEYSAKKEFFGKTVYRINEIPNKDVNIYISIAFHNTLSDTLNPVAATLYAKGFLNIYKFEDAISIFTDIISNIIQTHTLWMRSDTHEMCDIAKLKRVAEILSDEKSSILLEQIIAFRSNPSSQTYVFPDTQTQYFPDDIDLLNTKLRFVDIGAFIGDTLKAAVHYCIKKDMPPELMVMLEPDLLNYAKLLTEVKLQKQLVPECDFLLYPCGVWSENTILNFSNAGTSSSAFTKVSSENAISLPVISIDQTLLASSPNYIKMDIEGAEMEALLGAKETLYTYRPSLAICVYHKPSDLWEIPLYIESLNLDYNFYLRQHCHMGLETVLYCVPKSRNDLTSDHRDSIKSFNTEETIRKAHGRRR